MLLREHVGVDPSRPALVMASSGETVTFAQLEDRSSRLAGVFRSHGMRVGDHAALLMENQTRFLEVVWAALGSGLYITPINHHLTPDETLYIVDDCGASILVCSRGVAETALAIQSRRPRLRLLVVGGDELRLPDYENAIAGARPLIGDHAPLGAWMLYSSGTTGRPKGIIRPLSGASASEGFPRVRRVLTAFGFDARSVFLSPGPTYHAAPLQFSYGVQMLGGTVVMMERFDPAAALKALDTHHVTHSQWVPTMFIRMLALPAAARADHDLRSHRVALHSGAPCPDDVKRSMIDWWGPILREYYGASEGVGLVSISSQEWVSHPGSVGRPLEPTRVHILAADGTELGPQAIGTVYFEGESTFEYHNDPERTAGARDQRGWTTVGDIGYIDDDGYLYLTDRAGMTIITGGVNVYPQEVEKALAGHPAVVDVAVFGAPDHEWGETVCAVVQPVVEADLVELEAALRRRARERLAAFKCPRRYDFVDDLPRMESGKLNRVEVRRRFAVRPLGGGDLVRP